MSRLLALLLLTGCAASHRADSAHAPAVGLGEEFSLARKDSASLRDTGCVVTFTEVLEDSRCPAGVTCVWEGNARILVTATRGPLSQVFTLNTAQNRGGLVIFAGHVIELRKLEPWPTTPTPPGSFQNYTATLVVDGQAGI